MPAAAIARQGDGAEPGTALRLWVSLLVALVLLGMGCRVRQYLARTSYWNDEAFIVLNVVDHPASRMLGPLDYNQAAPPVFLWIERAMAVTLGSGEYSLRLFPLLAGLASLALFAVLAWRVLPGPAAMFAVAWFAFAQRLIIYCAEVKQYSSDALVAVLLILIAVGGARRRSAGGRFLLLAAVTAAAIWLSHTAAIVFGALSLALAVPCWREGRRARLWWLGGNVLVLVSLAALYRLSIVREQNPFLYRFWREGFPPTQHLLRTPVWLAARLYQLCREPYPPLPVLIAILAVLGAIELWLRRRFTVLAACVVPIALAVGAAFDRKYPFSPSRLTIYLLPGLVLLCGAGAAFLLTRLDRSLRPAGWALPVVVLGYAAVAAGARVIHPQFRSHIRPVVAYVRAHRRPGDVLYVLGPPNERHLEFYCYWRHPGGPVFDSFPGAGQISPGRFWIIFPFKPGHPNPYIQPAVDEARSVAVQVGTRFFVKQGGVAYLFDRVRPNHAKTPSAEPVASGKP